MHNLRSSAFLFLFIGPFYSPASASELTLRFRSGHSVSDIKPKYYKNDIVILLRGDKTEELISVDSLVYVRRESGPYTAAGIIFGVVGGGIVGGLIGNASGGERVSGGHPNLGPAFAVISGIAIGGLVGGIVGGIIGSNTTSDEMIDLSDADTIYKIEALKKFSR